MLWNGELYIIHIHDLLVLGLICLTYYGVLNYIIECCMVLLLRASKCDNAILM